MSWRNIGRGRIERRGEVTNTLLGPNTVSLDAKFGLVLNQKRHNETRGGVTYLLLIMQSYK